MVTKLSKKDLVNIFKDLINGSISRDEADRWAYSMMQAFDNNSLEFIPPSDESLLWEGIRYLYGIDIMEEPGEYLHSIEEIREEFFNKWSR